MRNINNKKQIKRHSPILIIHIHVRRICRSLNLKLIKKTARAATQRDEEHDMYLDTQTHLIRDLIVAHSTLLFEIFIDIFRFFLLLYCNYLNSDRLSFFPTSYSIKTHIFGVLCVYKLAA